GSMETLAGYAALVAESLIRILDIADNLGCTSAENLDLLRRGASPVVKRGPYRGELAEVDHIVPVILAPELKAEFANLELMPAPLNRRKGAKVGQRQLAHARRLKAAGVISRESFDTIARASR